MWTPMMTMMMVTGSDCVGDASDLAEVQIH